MDGSKCTSGCALDNRCAGPSPPSLTKRRSNVPIDEPRPNLATTSQYLADIRPFAPPSSPAMMSVPVSLLATLLEGVGGSIVMTQEDLFMPTNGWAVSEYNDPITRNRTYKVIKSGEMP